MGLPEDPAPKFQQVFNFRDLGGHVTAAGRRVRHGVLFRSAELTNATQSDMDLLAKQLGIRTLLDLRTPAELDQYGVIRNWSGSVVHHPLLGETDLLHPFPTLGDGYVDSIKRPHIGKRLVEVLALIVDKGALPAVFFCGAGKDRTGIVAAVILGSLGVPDEAIVDDYTRSAEALDMLYAFWAKNPDSTIDEAKRTMPHLMGTPRGATVNLLAATQRDFGSVRGYLEAQGAQRGLFEALETALLE